MVLRQKYGKILSLYFFIFTTLNLSLIFCIYFIT